MSGGCVRKKLMIALVVAAALTGCGGESDGAGMSNTPATATADTGWFNRGGDLNRASTLADWREADEQSRLASAADMLSMKVTRLPSRAEAVQMARTLEAEISEAAAADAGDDGYLGPVVDRVFAEQGW